ncbi:MAG TPA: metallophosphoesterase [Opitutales bacterium]|nr:metallophosphoesterase [Opitutales bacterium]
MIATAGLLTFRSSIWAKNDEIDPNYFVLLADTHIDQNSNRLLRGINPAETLDLAVKRIVTQRPRPAGVIINGDAANTTGLIGEYGLLAWLLRPLSEAGIPVYITMGNHDNRAAFYSVMPKMKPSTPLLEEAHVGIVDTPNAYLFLLDTLDPPNVSGILGEEQIEWIDKVLAQHSDKPVLLFGHHTPTGVGSGLLDVEKLFEVALAHKHAKAYFYGHSHRWEIKKHEDLHLVNQPATAHVFQEEQTQAYVHAHFAPDRVRLKFDCIDRNHVWHGESHSLPYR